ncbi:hypothetical protein [Paenibacillus sp. OK003]|uniref:hypothetical protein n=1 Tax=Paenibacillus sp. OK003 TaxID=1884380 RepID=UPI001587BB50|nr:hypothetical protein [Paenibacillus sp. OK003]
MFEEFLQHLRDEALSHKTIKTYEVTGKYLIIGLNLQIDWVKKWMLFMPPKKTELILSGNCIRLEGRKVNQQHLQPKICDFRSFKQDFQIFCSSRLYS